MPSACLICPNHDTCKSRATIGQTRHVIDAVVAVKVTAHKSVVLDCPLMHGFKRKGAFPPDVKAAVQYGENLKALAVAMNTIGAVSVNRTHEIISGLFGIPLSTGTISAMVSGCAHGLKGIGEVIRQKLVGSEAVNFDETGTRVDGKTAWVHNASNSEYTRLTIHAKEGPGRDGFWRGAEYV